MKKLLSTLVFSILVFVIGCQDNSITDPIQGVGQKELQKKDNSFVHQNTITLEGMLTDPHPVLNSYYEISGEIEYQHELKSLDPMPPNSQFLVSLNFSVFADFSYFCTVCEPETNDLLAGTISIETNDVIYVPTEGIYLLEKSFPIQGREDGMLLVCSFIVTTEGVSLNSKWLVLPEVANTNIVSQ